MSLQNWDAMLQQGLQCLCRACENFAAKLEQDEVGIKELRELTATMKELTALRQQLQREDEGEIPAVEVSFDGGPESWSQ